ncbi:MAG: SIS domain-containing protein [Ktedonobacterales bacterium]
MPTLLEREIASQPAMLARLLDRELDHIAAIIAELPSFEYVHIAARGSSDHAALYAGYAFAALAGHPVSLATPSLHTLYRTPPRLAGALVVGVSQSGQSPDILAVLEEGKRQGRPTLAITNDGASPLAALADHVVELGMGREESVAATKTYTAELAVIAAFAALWSGAHAHVEDLRRLPDQLAAALRRDEAESARVASYVAMDRCAVIARGYNYATAFELALKLKELTYVIATAYSSADFRHGPIATIEPGFPTFLITPSGATLDDMLELGAELRRRDADLIVISDAAAALTLATTAMPLPRGTPEWISPIVAVAPGQEFALRLALAKGLNPDVPRGLRKVTRTL